MTKTNETLSFYCFLCNKRKVCHHVKDEIGTARDNDFFLNYEFDMDNDFESETAVAPEDLKDILSKKTYPCKWV